MNANAQIEGRSGKIQPAATETASSTNLASSSYCWLQFTVSLDHFFSISKNHENQYRREAQSLFQVAATSGDWIANRILVQKDEFDYFLGQTYRTLFSVLKYRLEICSKNAFRFDVNHPNSLWHIEKNSTTWCFRKCLFANSNGISCTKMFIPVLKFQHAFTSSFQKYLFRMYKWIKMQHSWM